MNDKFWISSLRSVLQLAFVPALFLLPNILNDIYHKNMYWH